MKHFKTIIWLLLLLCVSPALAQRPSCPAIVDAALRAVDELCAGTERNQACYGNLALEATPRDSVIDFHFSEVGDIENVADLETMRLTPMDEEAGTWGVAMMKLQANLPGTVPGSNVTFLFFGDVEVTNGVAPDDEEHSPMQAFYLRSGIGDAPCAEAPESGLLVQTPHGVGAIAFTLNGVEVSLGSTVFFQVDEEAGMTVTTIEGSAALVVDEEAVPVLAGSTVGIPVDVNLQANVEAMIANPPVPQPYVPQQVAPLPVQVLEREIEIAEPLPQEQIDEVIELIEQGQPICGQPGLPSCHHVPEQLGGVACRIAEDTQADMSLPVCDSEEILPETTDEASSNGGGEAEITPEPTPAPTIGVTPRAASEATSEATPQAGAPIPTPEATPDGAENGGTGGSTPEASVEPTPLQELLPTPTPEVTVTPASEGTPEATP